MKIFLLFFGNMVYLASDGGLMMIFLLVAIMLWLALRMVVLWYFKINDILAELRAQTDALREISAKVTPKE